MAPGLFSIFGAGDDSPRPPETNDPVPLVDFVYEDLSTFVRPGISTGDIERRIESLLRHSSAVPYFKGYHGFPSIVSTPVNSQVVHTPPNTRRLESGDLLKVEFGLKVKQRHAFVGWTFPVGPVSPERARLIVGTHKAFTAALLEIRHGARTGSVSAAIQNELQRHELHPNRQYVGYRIGPQPVMRPSVPCFVAGPIGETPMMTEGMIFAVLVIAHAAQPELRVESSGWTVFDTRGADSVLYSAMVQVKRSGFNLLNQFPQWTPPVVRE